MWHNIVFCLVVDNFEVKTTLIDHIMHLKNSLEEHYSVIMDWKSLLFCGVNLDWNYPECIVKLNMPTYIPKAHVKFQHQHTQVLLLDLPFTPIHGFLVCISFTILSHCVHALPTTKEQNSS